LEGELVAVQGELVAVQGELVIVQVSKSLLVAGFTKPKTENRNKKRKLEKLSLWGNGGFYEEKAKKSEGRGGCDPGGENNSRGKKGVARRSMFKHSKKPF
jgi:hypothetical protein